VEAISGEGSLKHFRLEMRLRLGINDDTRFSSLWSSRKCFKDPSPLMASTRRTPERTLPSLRILIRPISPVACVCVPPQEFGGELADLHHAHAVAIFSPNSAIALYSLIATSIGTFSIVSTGVLRRTCLFHRSSMSCILVGDGGEVREIKTQDGQDQPASLPASRVHPGFAPERHAADA